MSKGQAKRKKNLRAEQVYQAIVRCGGSCSMTNQALAFVCDCSASTVARALKRLFDDCRILFVHSRASGFRGLQRTISPVEGTKTR